MQVKYNSTVITVLALVIMVTLIIVGILAVFGYTFYRYILYDILCKNSVNNTLKGYNIRKTQFEIISEYYKIKGKKLSSKEVTKLEKFYRQNEPEQFLLMYDTIRENLKNNGRNF